MAGARGNWTKALAIAVLLTGAARMSYPRTAPSTQDELSGSLAGKLTDLHSNPLAGVTVILRNQATGAQARAITAKNGAYRFSGLEPGEYALKAESPELGHGQVEQIVIAGGHEARVQAAIEFELPPPIPAVMASQDAERPKPQSKSKRIRPIPSRRLSP